jgi:RimJ/RimL family protein N-acetyltransferase
MNQKENTMQDIFRGDLVRLAAVSPEELAPLMSRWGRDSLRGRLLDSSAPILFSDKAMRGWLEKLIDKDSDYEFAIRTLADDRIVGEIGLGMARHNRGEAFVGIGLGDRDDWNKGYGTDAMRAILRYAFLELNLYRVSLSVFEYNPRAIRAYEKAGFQLEGRLRGTLHRAGRRWDEFFMGVLRPEWMEQYGSQL